MQGAIKLTPSPTSDDLLRIPRHTLPTDAVGYFVAVKIPEARPRRRRGGRGGGVAGIAVTSDGRGAAATAGGPGVAVGDRAGRTRRGRDGGPDAEDAAVATAVRTPKTPRSRRRRDDGPGRAKTSRSLQRTVRAKASRLRRAVRAGHRECAGPDLSANHRRGLEDDERPRLEDDERRGPARGGTRGL